MQQVRRTRNANYAREVSAEYFKD